MRSKNRYQNMITTYKNRREEARRECERVSKPYKERISRLSKKIKLLCREVKKYEKREQRITRVANKTREFSGQWVKNSFPSMGKEMVQVRRWFFKYCLENKIGRSIDLAGYTGCTLQTPQKARVALNRAMKSDPSQRELWLRYKAFISDESN
jgi:hypothetical protein